MIAATNFTVDAASVQNHFCGSTILGPTIIQAGRSITGTLISNVLIGFYILNQNQYSAWQPGLPNCDPYQAPGALFSAQEVSIVRVAWIAPETGQYYFLFVNQRYDPASLTFSLWYSPTQQYTMYQYTVTQTYTATSTGTETSALPQSRPTA
jgi:hypothetical protein